MKYYLLLLKINSSGFNIDQFHEKLSSKYSEVVQLNSESFIIITNNLIKSLNFSIHSIIGSGNSFLLFDITKSEADQYNLSLTDKDVYEYLKDLKILR
ncbi:hypothetical protein FWJ33_04180 [Leptospira interrogans serovar Hardjo]|nr:hypothetical protein FWJ33_04180 [Leptospira interrogans serovar Hardjo]